MTASLIGYNGTTKKVIIYMYLQQYYDGYWHNIHWEKDEFNKSYGVQQSTIRAVAQAENIVLESVTMHTVLMINMKITLPTVPSIITKIMKRFRKPPFGGFF